MARKGESAGGDRPKKDRPRRKEAGERAIERSPVKSKAPELAPTEPAVDGEPQPEKLSQPQDRTLGDEEKSFLVVGLGASAGGLEAITDLLSALPATPGIAFVFIQHLDPHHKSSLTEILSRTAKMPVVEIIDALAIQPNHFYVTPSNKDVAILHGILHLMSRPDMPGRHLPVDYFFRALAQDMGNRAVGVVLSGTGSDGTAGLREIRAEGGITVAQSPETSKYSGMPQSAVSTGEVDFVLPVKAIAHELVRLSNHPRARMAPRRRPAHAILDSTDALQKIFVLLRKSSGVDFSHYKQSTVERRLSRRMLLHKIESLVQYVKFLEQNPAEVGALFEDMLVHVTGFFRDPKVFDTLKQKVLPRIFEQKAPEAVLRVWVPASSTGEEPYSLAITLLEYMNENELNSTVQIFATDISNSAIECARQGKYLEDIAQDVSPERLRRYFVKTSSGYQISKAIRDMCVFARQNVAKDPPFSSLDLLSCRNLLIYMDPTFQRRIVPTFHYALKPTGFLMLGQAETVGSFSDLFSMVDRVHKIYVKKPGTVRVPLEVDGGFIPRVNTPDKPLPFPPPSELSLERLADRVAIARYSPPGVVINAEMEIVQFRGQTGKFLEPAPGTASWNLMKMAREGLSLDLRAAVHKAGKKKAPARAEGLRARFNGHEITVNIEVIPLPVSQAEEQYFLVLFEEAAPPARAPKEPPASGRGPATEQAKEVQRLRAELAQTKETLQHIIEEHETTNEELRAANEEIQSANEELQSTNEELETAKEELQSTNEELTTLNTELENQNLELNQAIDDFSNLHNSVNIPVVLLGGDLRIRAFTPPAERSLKLIPADSGRPIRELRLGIEIEDLEHKVTEVIETLNTREEEVRAHDGTWYLMRIRPYRTVDNKISGAVLALIDIHERKVAEEKLLAAQVFAESVVATVRGPLIVLDSEMHVKSANPAFYRAFRESPAQTEGRLFYDLGNRQWDIPRLRELLTRVIPKDGVVDDFEVEHEFPQIGHRKMLLNARRINQGPGRQELILLGFEDVKG